MNHAPWKYPVHWLAYGLGSGLAPFAPGTFGSLIGVVLYWFMAPLSPVVYAAVTAGLFLAGIFICGQTARDIGATDPGKIVFDEIVGFLVAMYLVPASWPWILAGFLLFRLFDIWKPWPIHVAEHKLGLGTGIMADDVLAGFYALALLQAALLVLERLPA
jgi:phosphatidylglycerophosphatase A